MSPTTTFSVQSRLEDPLAFLPCTPAKAYRRGEIIYSSDRRSDGIFCVWSGKVKVFRLEADNGRQILLDVYQKDDVFGEAAFLGTAYGLESAVALEDSEIMFWTIAQIETVSLARPQLALSLMILFVRRTVLLKQRIESFATDGIAQRLVRTLFFMSNRFGITRDDGSIQIMPISHELLSQYIGTSRELVTHNMKLFRDLGYLQYSRKGIFLTSHAKEELLSRFRPFSKKFESPAARRRS